MTVHIGSKIYTEYKNILMPAGQHPFWQQTAPLAALHTLLVPVLNFLLIMHGKPLTGQIQMKMIAGKLKRETRNNGLSFILLIR